MPDPTSYQLAVWACRRERDDDPITHWQARASWGCPERQATGEPKDCEVSAINSARDAMGEAVAKEKRQRTLEQALETGAFV